MGLLSENPRITPVTTAKAQVAPAAHKPATAAHPSLRALERPVNLMGTNAPAFGSDVIADTLRALEIPFIALNPGASYRGLHDSIVNFLGNETPQMLLCLHEESAVAVAHGYAKVTGKPMAAAVHSNVGLFHATMAIFNAWCDRQPVIVLGATGPVDAVKRRPWIDWIHTARDQGAIVRNYTKWDDQPASPAAAREALLRAAWIASTAPRGPVYVNLDAEMQEAKLPEPLAPMQVARFMPPASPTASAELIENAAAILKAAKHPVMLMGRVSRSVEAWNERVALAETLNAKVISDLKIGCGFPTDHPLHAGAPASNAMVPEAIAAMKAAVGERDVTLTHLPLSWNGASWAFRHPLDYIGSEGGGGVGGGPGISVGAALALKDSGRLPIAICGDGDFCMGVTALWTAVHYRIPLLVVVCNNRSFFNDELHQERVARIRNRPPENRWIGQRISDPEIDCAGLAAAQGAVGFEPVMRTADLVPTFEKAIAAVEAGQVAVVDVRVEPGYSAGATAAMLRGTEK